eukprot:TRINITY_DN2020_c0_g1_i1.p1 TRINITY_DN2020_c0_g1~~TRINITY_DN2020_c0_g1_i1.p1  ORF type:complete len:201 (+),score=18.79 TRINITY_DN2020_c0_g1_i1:280-882(+)
MRVWFCVVLVLVVLFINTECLPLWFKQNDEMFHSKVQVQGAPVWPTAFAANFTVTVLGFDIFSAPSTLYYDWNQKAQRIDFGSCTDGSNPPPPCSFIFTSNIYLLKEHSCCISVPNIGTLPPQWPSILQFQRDLLVQGQKSEWWKGGTPVHNLFQSIDHPSESLFLWVEDINETWSFQPFKDGPQNPSLFTVPVDCTSSC